MKPKQIIFQILLLLSLVFCHSTTSSAQTYFNLKAGVGYSELIGISAGVQASQIQIMVGAGTIPLPDEKLFTIYTDIYLHLFGRPAKSEIKPWYGKFGISYVKDETDSWIDKYSYLNLRIGRSLLNMENVSLELDFGVGIELSYEREEIMPTTSFLNIEFAALPLVGIRFGYHWRQI